MGHPQINEFNAIVKDNRYVDLKFGLVYPSTYRVGMANLGIQILYSILNSIDYVSCERYYLVDVPKPTFSVESQRKLIDNDIVGVSLQFEQDFPYVVKYFREANIPVKSSDRTDQHPLIIAGGPISWSNPMPISEFFDAFIIGEAEDVLRKIVDVVLSCSSRNECLNELASLEGIWIPAFGKYPVRRLYVPDLNNVPFAIHQVFPDVSSNSKLIPVYGHAYLLELVRGCKHACKFCLIGHTVRPVRYRSLSMVKEIIKKGTANGLYTKVALIGSSIGDFPDLKDLLEWILDYGLGFSVPSLRADTIDEDIAELLYLGGEHTLTIAPETGSERLRNRIAKGISNAQIINAVENAINAKINFIKLYFLMGLPGETDDDIKGISKLLSQISDMKPFRITASLNPFIPKPHTPYEHEKLEPLDELRRKRKLAEKSLKHIPRVYFEGMDVRWARIQAILSRGGNNLAPLIELVSLYGNTLGSWRRAIKELNLDWNTLLNLEYDNTVPWDFIKI